MWMAGEVHRAFVHQASEPDGGGHLRPAEIILMVGQPVHITFGDDTAVQGLQEELTDGHGSDVTTSLHHANVKP